MLNSGNAVYTTNEKGHIRDAKPFNQLFAQFHATPLEQLYVCFVCGEPSRASCTLNSQSAQKYESVKRCIENLKMTLAS